MMNNATIISHQYIGGMIIALMGFKGSGKNTVADRLVSAHGFSPLAFADPVKEACAAIFSWDRSLLEGNTEESRIWREEIDAWWANRLGIPNFTPRFAMQNFGTDLMRNNFHDDIWLINAERRIHNHNGNVVISDARFQNEVKMIRRLGGFIYRVKRGPDPTWMDIAKKANQGDELAKAQLIDVHASEWNWIGAQLDGILHNDSSVDDLWDQTDEMFKNLTKTR